MAASYPTSVKTWTDVADNTDTVLAAHINEAYEEIIAVETDLINNVGNRTYTEQNYVTDSESITASIDALDMSVKKDVCKMRLVTAQSLANNSVEIIKFNDDVVDTNDMADTTNNRVYIKKDGVYLITGVVYMANPENTTGIRAVYLAVNNTIVTSNGMNLLPTHAAGWNVTPFSTTWLLESGDYIDIRMFQSTGAARAIGIDNRTDWSVIQL
jgi:hypothetical protein